MLFVFALKPTARETRLLQNLNFENSPRKLLVTTTRTDSVEKEWKCAQLLRQIKNREIDQTYHSL